MSEQYPDIEAVLNGENTGAFSANPVTPHDTKAMPELIKEDMKQEEHPLIKEMFQNVKNVQQYCEERGEMGGMDWGFDSMNKAFEGLNAGVHLIAGQSNIGKSAICMQLAWQIAQANQIPTKQRPQRAFVLYFSLDDSLNELLPRFVAIDQRIPINAVRFPSKPEYNQDKVWVERRKEGWRRIESNLLSISMRDVNRGSSVEYIEKTIDDYASMLKMYDENYQVVVVIDNFHDITVEAKGYTEDNARFDYISDQLSRICAKYDCPMICTAEFRKLNGFRRPTNDDIKQSGKILYEAKAVMLSYNQVSLRGEQAEIYWEDENNPNKKMPVYEMYVSKNKFGSFKGTFFFNFIPHMSYFAEVMEAQTQRYNQMVYG